MLVTHNKSKHVALLALHNVLMEAKFSEKPKKKEIISSPFVANLANKVCDILEDKYKPSRMDILRKRPPEYNAWKEWRENPCMDQLSSHILRHSPEEWMTWESTQKEVWLKNVLAPYKLAGLEIQELLKVLESET